MKKYKPFFKYIGSDYLKLDIIFKLADKSKPTFIEVFGGSGIVSMNATQYYKHVVYNDADKLITNFFNILKYKREEFIDRINLLPKSRELYEHVKEIMKEINKLNLTNMEKAIYLFYWYATTRAGGSTFRYGSTRSSDARLDYRNYINNIKEQAKLWEDITIECFDFRELVKRYDREYVVFYFDPPYFTTNNYYNPDWSQKDVDDLINILNNLQGQYILKVSSTDAEYYSKYLKNYYREDRKFTNSNTNTINKPRTKYTFTFFTNRYKQTLDAYQII